MLNPDDVLVATRNLIIHYLQRRRETVVEILLETRPQAFEWYEQEYGPHGIDLKPYFSKFDGHPREVEFQQRGIWRNEWEHYFHGIGCRLTHLQTGESFDWDVSNPAHFYNGEFFSHLEWRVEHQSNNREVQYYVRWHKQNSATTLFPILEENQVIRPIPQQWTPNRWQLVK